MRFFEEGSRPRVLFRRGRSTADASQRGWSTETEFCRGQDHRGRTLYYVGVAREYRLTRLWLCGFDIFSISTLLDQAL